MDARSVDEPRGGCRGPRRPQGPGGVARWCRKNGPMQGSLSGFGWAVQHSGCPVQPAGSVTSRSPRIVVRFGRDRKGRRCHSHGGATGRWRFPRHTFRSVLECLGGSARALETVATFGGTDPNAFRLWHDRRRRRRWAFLRRESLWWLCPFPHRSSGRFFEWNGRELWNHGVASPNRDLQPVLTYPPQDTYHRGAKASEARRGPHSR